MKPAGSDALWQACEKLKVRLLSVLLVIGGHVGLLYTTYKASELEFGWTAVGSAKATAMRVSLLIAPLEIPAKTGLLHTSASTIETPTSESLVDLGLINSSETATIETLSPLNELFLETLYFEDHSVDSPATPLGEWVVNAELWPLGKRAHIDVKVWISSTGMIERWEVLDKDVPQAFRDSLADLPRTAMNPAQLGDRTVASIRYIRIYVDRAAFVK